jgi:hypothetical protein
MKNNIKEPRILHGSLFRLFACLLVPAEQTHYKQQDHSTDDRYDQAGEIKAGHSLSSEKAHNPAADERTQDADNNIGACPHLPVPSHDNASDPSGKRTEDNPYQPVHFASMRNWCADNKFIILRMNEPGSTIDLYLCLEAGKRDNKSYLNSL